MFSRPFMGRNNGQTRIANFNASNQHQMVLQWLFPDLSRVEALVDMQSFITKSPSAGETCPKYSWLAGSGFGFEESLSLDLFGMRRLFIERTLATKPFVHLWKRKAKVMLKECPRSRNYGSLSSKSLAVNFKRKLASWQVCCWSYFVHIRCQFKTFLTSHEELFKL